MGHTKAVFDEVIEGVAVAIVGELVVGSRELLKALGGDTGEISSKLRVLGENHRSPSHEAVDQRLLPHFTPPKTLALYHQGTNQPKQQPQKLQSSDTKTETMGSENEMLDLHYQK
jgi:hypothetical protein